MNIQSIDNTKPQDAIDSPKPQLQMVGLNQTGVNTTLNTTSTTYDDTSVTYNSITQIYADSPSGGLNVDTKPQLVSIQQI